MKRACIFTSAVLLASCQDDTGQIESNLTDGGVSDSSCEVSDPSCEVSDPSCEVTGFSATASHFALPAAYGGFTSVSGLADSGDCWEDRPAFATTDLTGDGKPDLVVYRACGQSSVGVSSWLVHENTGTGFAAAPIPFALPPGYDGFYSSGGLEDSGACYTGKNRPAFLTTDMTGDGKPDLVIYKSCTDSTVGRERWLVHVNTGAGFDPIEISFALPAQYAIQPGLSGWKDCTPTGERPAFAIKDLTGDHRPDLVVSAWCNAPEVGATHWLVHENIGSGFDPTPIEFGLPPDHGGYPGLTVRGSCLFNEPGYTTLDMTGDDRPDLVVFWSCGEPLASSTMWRVYPNTGSGFASTAIPFALPAEYDGFGGLEEMRDPGYCQDTNQPGFLVTELTGDHRPDLVVYRACSDRTVGQTHWLVYRNTGTGFDPASSLTLPSGYDRFTDTCCSATDELGEMVGQQVCVNGLGQPANRPGFVATDLLGDGKQQLVVFGACQDSSIGVSEWLVYPQACAP
jgi:hypothetical protein